MTVDLNADAGESFGSWRMGDDETLFPHLTSVNLACGFHAGDPVTIGKTVRLAKDTGVAVGAHPGFPDLMGFGRREMASSSDEVYADVLYQIGAIHAFVRAVGLSLHHVKPHGALYLKMMRHAETADGVARAVHDFDKSLPLVVLGGSGGQVMREAATRYDLRVVQEAFPDRAYLSNGQLVGRNVPGAVVHEPEQAAVRAVRMMLEGKVEALDGGAATVEAQTLCIHGDNPNAPLIAKAVREALEIAGVNVRAF